MISSTNLVKTPVATNELSATIMILKLPNIRLNLTILVRSFGDMTLNTTGRAFGLLGGAAWENTYTLAKTWAVNFLVVALAGVGLNTRFRLLKGLGVKPFLVGLGAALSVGVVSFTIISLLGRFMPG